MLTILYGKLETKAELLTTLLETILTVEYCVLLTPVPIYVEPFHLAQSLRKKRKFLKCVV